MIEHDPLADRVRHRQRVRAHRQFGRVGEEREEVAQKERVLVGAADAGEDITHLRLALLECLIVERQPADGDMARDHFQHDIDVRQAGDDRAERTEGELRGGAADGQVAVLLVELGEDLPVPLQQRAVQPEDAQFLDWRIGRQQITEVVEAALIRRAAGEQREELPAIFRLIDERWAPRRRRRAAPATTRARPARRSPR